MFKEIGGLKRRVRDYLDEYHVARFVLVGQPHRYAEGAANEWVCRFDEAYGPNAMLVHQLNRQFEHRVFVSGVPLDHELAPNDILIVRKGREACVYPWEPKIDRLIYVGEVNIWR